MVAFGNFPAPGTLPCLASTSLCAGADSTLSLLASLPYTKLYFTPSKNQGYGSHFFKPSIVASFFYS